MSRFDDLFARRAGILADQGMLRALRVADPLPGGVRLGGGDLVNFSSNDYLGLARHPLLIERSRDWTSRWGTGAAASRLVCGTLEAHLQVEAKIAALKGTEAALIFNSGWQANATILPALLHRDVVDSEPLVFTDRLNHASLHQGCLAAGVRQIRFRHNDLDHLETLLRTHCTGQARAFIVTESVFSMDGDRVDIATLADLADRYNAFLYLDEAHATGVLGPSGAGLSGLGGGRVDLVMGTFSKALGGFGAFVAGSRALCDHLINHASGFIYATALPPAVLGAVDAALDLLPTLDQERAHLAALSQRLRDGLAARGYAISGSTTQIVPAVIGDPTAVLAQADRLREAGYLAVAIRPPTVPSGTSRIRFALSSAHRAEDIDAVIALLDGKSGSAGA